MGRESFLNATYRAARLVYPFFAKHLNISKIVLNIYAKYTDLRHLSGISGILNIIRSTALESVSQLQKSGRVVQHGLAVRMALPGEVLEVAVRAAVLDRAAETSWDGLVRLGTLHCRPDRGRGW